jgi:hypothetical protein
MADPDLNNDYDFEQMIAECCVRLGDNIVKPLVQEHIERHGWPIPVESRPKLLVTLGTMCMLKDTMSVDIIRLRKE